MCMLKGCETESVMIFCKAHRELMDMLKINLTDGRLYDHCQSGEALANTLIRNPDRIYEVGRRFYKMTEREVHMELKLRYKK